MPLTIGTQTKKLAWECPFPVLGNPDPLIHLAYALWQKESTQQGRRALRVARRQTANQLGMSLRRSVSCSTALAPEKGYAREPQAGEARSALGWSFSKAVWCEHTYPLC